MSTGTVLKRKSVDELTKQDQDHQTAVATITTTILRQHLHDGGGFGTVQVQHQVQPAPDVRNYVLELIRDQRELAELVEYATAYAQSIGLVSRSVEHSASSEPAVIPPLALLPSPFPREAYAHAWQVHEALSLAYFRVACDHDFLMECFREMVKTDPFIARMVSIVQRLHAEGLHQPLVVALQRADYLVHWDPQRVQDGMQLKQVEMNIGPIGGPGCATQVAKMHGKLLDRLEIVHGAPLPIMAMGEKPEMRTRQRMGQTLYQAWKLFGDPGAVLVYISNSVADPVCHFEQLQFVQFEVEKLAKREGQRVEVVPMTLGEAAQRLTLDEARDFSLYVDGRKRVALVHITEGNMPEEYPTEREWEARIRMERSNAILSPNLRLELSSSKKIQQVLAKRGMLERFLPDNSKDCAELRRTFTGLWGLEKDDEETRAVIQDALRHPQNYVLKCQLEAGKGNFFDEELAKKLGQLSLEERGAFILQQKIKPLAVKNFMMRPFKPLELDDVVGELGIFGSLIGDQCSGKVLWNTVDGHELKTKSASVNEAGVCAGYGVVDSALLFPARFFCSQTAS